MHSFIQIDEEGYVVGVHFSSVPFDDPLYILWDNEIESDIFQKRYIDGKFVNIELEPTTNEILEQIAINTEYLAAVTEMEADA